jgi:hypothetical protein
MLSGMSEDIDPRPPPDADERARALYWRELVQLKVDAEHAQHYRDHLSELLTWFDIMRAIVSVGAPGFWVAGIGYPQLWGGIIVASQVAQAVLTKLPLTARHKGLMAFTNALDAMLIDALLEWEDMQTEDSDARAITRRWHTLMRLRHEAETKNLAIGLPLKRRLFRLAEQTATTYFETNYGTRPMS